LLVGEIAIGVGLAAATLIGLGWHLRPLDYRGIAGGQVRSTARVTTVKVTGLFLAFVTVLVLMFESALQKWSHYRMGSVAIYALCGLEAMLALELQRQTDTLIDQRRGAEGEEVVRDELDVLRDEGWLVLHNYEKPYGGNVDHIVVGPHGAFAIETKAGRYRAGNVGQAIGSAMAVRERAGLGWVTAVVCVPNHGTPTQKGAAWLVGRDNLAEWLRGARLHRGRPINVDDATARLLPSGATM
jgi:hypothetical protein